MKSTFVDELKTELRNDPSRLSWYVEFVSLDCQRQNRILSKEAPNAVVVALLAAVLEALQPLNHPMFSTLDVILDPETALHSKAMCVGEERAAYVPSLVCVVLRPPQPHHLSAPVLHCAEGAPRSSPS